MKNPFRLAALAIIFFFVGLFAPAAQAEEPLRTTGAVTDTTGTISTAKLEQKIADYQNSTGISLRFVFVDSFDSYSADDWAKRTATASSLSNSDSLVAVAITTRQTSYFVGRNSDLSEKELTAALKTSDVLDQWRSGKWAEGSITAVGILADSSSSGSKAVWTTIICVIIIGALLTLVFSRRKKKLGSPTSQALLDSLAKRASSELLAIDDGVRSAAAELEFAKAEFGIEATRNFSAALTQAQNCVQQAFVIQQQLNDDQPETPDQQRQMNERIVALSSSARQLITSQSEGFRKLRNLSSRVDQRLSELAMRAREIEEELPILRAEIDNLAVTHSAESVATLRTYPEQIVTFLSSARTSIASGEEAVASGKRNDAVSYARLAEDTLAQASSRVSLIKGAQSTLANAHDKLSAAIRSISSDIADAQRLGANDPTITSRKEEAQKLVALYSREGIDPIKALADLTTAEDALDTALIGVRQADEVRQRESNMALRQRDLAIATIDRVNRSIDDYGFNIDGNVRGPLAKAREYIASGDSASDLETKTKFYRSALSAAQRAERSLDATFSKFSHGNRHGSSSGFDGMGMLLAGMAINAIFNSGGRSGPRQAGFGGNFGGFGGFGGGGNSGPSGSSGGFSF